MNLLYFIIGLVFALYLSPILDGVVYLFLTWIEFLKATISEKISLIELNLRQQMEEEPLQRQIGFYIEDDEEEECDYED